jgi:hypothetical protein
MPLRIGVILGRTGGPVEVDTIGARLGRTGAPSAEVNTSSCLAGLFIGIGMMGRLFTDVIKDVILEGGIGWTKSKVEEVLEVEELRLLFTVAPELE